MAIHQRPKGAELDRLVIWAIGSLNQLYPDTFLGTETLMFYVANKVGRVGIDDTDHTFGKMVTRATKRCQDAGLIEFDDCDGLRLVPAEGR